MAVNNLSDDISNQAIAKHVAFICVTSVFYTLRIYTRLTMLKNLGWDDAFLGLGLGCAVFTDVLISVSKVWGMGRHVETVGEEDYIKFFRCLYIMQPFYAAGTCFIRTSLLLFYRRLTPEARYRYTATAILVLNITVFTGCIGPVLFGCKPVSFYWDKRGGEGTCIRYDQLYLANGIMNIILDAATLTLPVVIIWGTIALPLKNKLKVTVLFLLGGMACIAGFMRLPKAAVALDVESPTADLTYRVPEFIWWSQLELHLAIIAACIPTIRPLFLRASDAVRSRITGSKYGTHTAGVLGSETMNSRVEWKTDPEYPLNPPVDADREFVDLKEAPAMDAYLDLSDSKEGSKEGSNLTPPLDGTSELDMVMVSEPGPSRRS